jgi:DNA-binding PadR family transcriptional regulator
MPFMHDIVNRLPMSRSTTYRYLVWGAKLGYITLGTRKRGKTDATTFAISEAGEDWLSQWHKLQIAEWNELAFQTARAL